MSDPSAKSNMTATTVSASMTTRYYVFLVIYMVLLSAFGSFVNDMFLPALPKMMKVFRTDISQIQLSLTMGMIGLGVGEIVFGPLSDKHGRKPILLFALILFFISAVASIFSRSLSFFLFCRLVQGLGGSAGYFLARTIPADLFGGKKLAHFMGVIGAINGLAPALAPTIGGLLDESVGWKGIFLVLAGFSVILLILFPEFKETLPSERRQQGGIKTAIGNYKSLFLNKKFMVHVMMKDVGLGMMFAYISASPFIIQTHFGYSPEMFGVFVGLNAILLGIGSFVASRFKILKNASYLGAWISMAAVIGEAVCLLIVDSFLMLELLLLPLLFAMGMIFTVGNTLAMNEGRNNAGAASAILGLFGYVFGAAISPVMGMGNILHTTAWVFIFMGAIVLVLSYMAYRMPGDLDNDSQ